ncbi:MAG: hypothetical protein ACFFD4_38975 [Candidatus Odinarchaeota archaeon]
MRNFRLPNKKELKERLWDWFYHVYGPIFCWCQRRKRGFDDLEVGDLDRAIIDFTLPRLKRYRETDIGFPPEFHEDPLGDFKRSEEEAKRLDDEAAKAWDETLQKMIRAFELWLEHGGLFGHVDEEADKFVEDKELEAEFKEGWELFCKYFFALWY